MNQQYKKRLQYGENFENRFAQYLTRIGHRVITFYRFDDNGAPLLLGDKYNYILPDILAYKKSEASWFECKRKKRMPDGYTGYKLKCHEDYKKIQHLTGHRIFIAFEDEEEWYGNYLDELEKGPNKIIKIKGIKHIVFQYPKAFLRINNEPL